MNVKKTWDDFSHSILYSVLVYTLFGVLWITLSDQLLFLLIPNRELLSQIQTWKGWFYVLVTSVLLYYLIRRHRIWLQEREAENFRILNLVPIPIIVVYYDGSIHLVNHSCTQTFGYTVSDIPTAEDWFSKAYPDMDYRNQIKEAWGQYIRIPGEERDLTIPPVFRVRDKWGNDRTVEFYALPVEKGELVVCKDITQQKKEQENSNQVDKMRALGQLAGGIAHDFNNQLSAIIGYTDLLNDQLPEDETTRSYLASVIEASETAASLTRQLLAFGRKTPYRLKELDFRKNIDTITSLIERTFPKKIRLEKDLQSSSYQVIGHGSQLQNMLLNLVINARDSMAKGGTLRLETRSKYKETSVINGLPLEGGDYLIISVTDQGCGIPENIQKNIFEPFFSTKGKHKGTGLGLSTVYRTLELHRGAVELESRPGKGSTFTLMLPLAHSHG